jgi:murein DD-endopeptidase MepM/ murein hydrolase activator NlpD
MGNSEEMTGAFMVEDKFRSGHPFRSVLIVLGIVLLAAIAQGIFCVGGPPGVKIEPGMPAIGKRTPVKIEVSEPRRGIAHVRVDLVQGDKAARLADKGYSVSSQFILGGAKTAKDILSVEAGKQALPALTGGTAAIRVTVERAGTWLRSPAPQVEEVVLPVRLTPPSLQIVSTQTYVAQGGCEAVVFRVGESAVRSGVRAGAWWFPGFPLPGGGKQDRFALFSVPYDMTEPNVRLVAEDAAGNSAEMGFVDQFFPKPAKSDNMEIGDAFLSKVVPEILSQTPELKDRGSLLDNYLAINRELRQKDGEVVKQLALKSRPAFLWTRPFSMIPNGKVMAAFADRRTYLYQGKVIDHQTHLGYDLAVTKQSPVPAANGGIVVFARYFGIYGNAVLIDHGYGLMTIYGHLSSISVKEGQQVGHGEVIGKTGETGLAGGDHLHFSTILQGLPVTPVEWCDGHWIKDRISKKLGPALAYSER